MKIDVSTVLLVIICIIPGLFAQRSRNRICPRSFDEQGASAELGELVALGLSTHGLLICTAAAIMLLFGVLRGHSTYLFQKLDAWDIGNWVTSHRSGALLLGTAYVFSSFGFSHWLGFFYGIWRFRSPVTSAVLGKAKWLQKLGVNGLLGERPIIYEALSPDRRESDKLSYLVFVEIEMKGGLGFYSGQISQFSIVSDEEPHKLIYLVSAWYKPIRTEPYEPLDVSGVMLDLADSVQMRVKQVPPTNE